MAFDFPNTPTIGERWPNPAIAGQPQYQWNGTEWTAATFDPAGYVKRTGDTMTGALSLSGDPTQALHAVPKQYIDAQRQNVSLAGGKSFDIQVPAGAQAVRVNGVIIPTSGNQTHPHFYVSLVNGVFRTSTSDYSLNGFMHSTLTSPTDCININAAAGGIAISNSHSNAVTSLIFDGTIMLKRPNTTTLFTSEIRAVAYNSSNTVHNFHFTYVQGAAGNELAVLALRLASVPGDNWATGSFVRMEWM